MAINDFTGKNIQDTYQRVVQTDGTNLANGTGSLLPISFDGNNVIISGSLTAQTYVVSESITNVTSGSTIFGNTPDDTHTFTGAITSSGDISSSAAIYGTKFQAYNGGFLGSLLTSNKLTIHEIDSNIEAFEVESSAFKASILMRYNNAARVYIDPVNDSYIHTNGNFGIGYTTPSYKLDVNGTGRFVSFLRTDSSLTVVANSIFGSTSQGGNLNTHTFIGNITASNNISGSAAGTVSAGSGSFHVLKGDTTKATGLFVNGTITASGNISSSGNIIGTTINAGEFLGTIATAAQPQITSVGTLSTLTVDNIIINGTNIGHTSDTDSIAIASNGVVTFSQIPVLPANTIDSTHYVDGSIDTAHIADDQVTYAKMQHTSTNNRVLGATSAGAISEVQVATDMIAADAVTSAKIADDAIEEEHIGAGEVKTAAIADDQITLDKLASIDAGHIIYGDASNNPASLAEGSDGQVLTLASGLPSWAAAGGASGAQTGITSVLNASLVVGRDSHNQIDFSTDNEIHFKTNNETPVIKMKASGEIEATTFDGALEGNADTATALATARAINGVDFDGTGAITVTAAGSTLSDTVTVAKGGTNATSFADKSVIITQDSGTDTLAAVAMSTNGQLLIGGSSGPAVATLTAGNGIAVTNADGGITIATNLTAGDGLTLNTADIDLDASLTTVTSLLNTSLAIGRDSTDQIKFGTDNQIIFRVGDADGVTFKASGEIEATKFDGDLEGNADTATALATARNIGGVSFDGTGNIDLPGVNAAGNQNTTGTATNATNAAHIAVADNENTNEENLIPFIEDASATGNVGLESDGDFTYNPSTGTVSAGKIVASGTVVGSNTIKMANTKEFQLSSTSVNTSTNDTWFHSNNETEQKADQFADDTGLTGNIADGVSTITPQQAIIGGKYMVPTNTTCSIWRGVMSNQNPYEAVVALCKVTPVDNNSTALPLTVIASASIDGKGNAKARTFEATLQNPHLDAGDIIVPLLNRKNSAGGQFHINSTILFYTET